MKSQNKTAWGPKARWVKVLRKTVNIYYYTYIKVFFLLCNLLVLKRLGNLKEFFL